MSSWQRLSDISNLVGDDWVKLANQLGLNATDINNIKSELSESSVPHQALAMLKLWIQTAGNKASGIILYSIYYINMYSVLLIYLTSIQMVLS